jgi:hypothetical protein
MPLLSKRGAIIVYGAPALFAEFVSG